MTKLVAATTGIVQVVDFQKDEPLKKLAQHVTEYSPDVKYQIFRDLMKPNNRLVLISSTVFDGAWKRAFSLKLSKKFYRGLGKIGNFLFF